MLQSHNDILLRRHHAMYAKRLVDTTRNMCDFSIEAGPMIMPHGRPKATPLTPDISLL